MIAYKIQLQYVIRDKIQSETKSKKFFPDKVFFCWEKIFTGKKFSDFVSDWILSWIPVCFFLSCLGQIDAYHH